MTNERPPMPPEDGWEDGRDDTVDDVDLSNISSIGDLLNWNDKQSGPTPMFDEDFEFDVDGIGPLELDVDEINVMTSRFDVAVYIEGRGPGGAVGTLHIRKPNAFDAFRFAAYLSTLGDLKIRVGR